MRSLESSTDRQTPQTSPPVSSCSAVVGARSANRSSRQGHEVAFGRVRIALERHPRENCVAVPDGDFESRTIFERCRQESHAFSCFREDDFVWQTTHGQNFVNATDRPCCARVLRRPRDTLRATWVEKARKSARERLTARIHGCLSGPVTTSPLYDVISVQGQRQLLLGSLNRSRRARH